MALVLSSKAHARIVSIDWSSALAMDGVVDKVDHTDVPGPNKLGSFLTEEEIYASKKVKLSRVSVLTTDS